MALTVLARGGLGRLDPLDNSLVLLSLHSACLGIAGGFLGKTELSSTFHIPWMMTGFSIGAVLAVVAGYYGLINNGALRDYLASPPSGDDASATKVSGPTRSNEIVGSIAAEDSAKDPQPVDRPPRPQPLLVGPWIIAAVCVAVVLWAYLAFGPGPEVVEAEARQKDSLRSLVIAGTIAVVLLPLPLIWTRTSPLITFSRNLLLLGSLLTFVLSVTIAMVPAAAASIAEAAEQISKGPTVSEAAREIEVRVLQTSDNASPSRRPGTNDERGGVQTGTTGDGDDPAETNSQVSTEAPADLPTREDIYRLEREILSLEARVVSAINAREIRVNVPAPRVEPRITLAPNVEVDVPEPVVISQIGERGEPGRPAPVRECEWVWALWPRDCRYVDQPAQLPAPAPVTPF